MRSLAPPCCYAAASVALSVLLSACGGGSGGSSSPPAPVNQALGGIWQGQFTPTAGSSVDGSAFVAEDGSLFSEATDSSSDCAYVMTGTLSASGAAVTGSVRVAM